MDSLTLWLQDLARHPAIARPRCCCTENAGVVRFSTCRPCGSTMSSSPMAALLVRGSPGHCGGWGSGESKSEGDPCALVSVSPTVNFWYDMEYDPSTVTFQLLDSH